MDWEKRRLIRSVSRDGHCRKHRLVMYREGTSGFGLGFLIVCYCYSSWFKKDVLTNRWL